MTPDEVRCKVVAAYKKAIQERNVYQQHTSTLQFTFQDLKLYGADAGADFASTHVDAIVEEAVSQAECKRESLIIPLHGWGSAAKDGAAAALGSLTGIRVAVNASGLTLSWGDPGSRRD